LDATADIAYNYEDCRYPRSVRPRIAQSYLPLLAMSTAVTIADPGLPNHGYNLATRGVRPAVFG
jgi:hypothetical protein